MYAPLATKGKMARCKKGQLDCGIVIYRLRPHVPSLPRRRRIPGRPSPRPIVVRLLLLAGNLTETRHILWRYLYGQCRDDCDPTYGIPSYRTLRRIHGREVYLILDHAENSACLTDPENTLSYTDAIVTIIGQTQPGSAPSEAERIRLEVLGPELDELYDAKNPIPESIVVLRNIQASSLHVQSEKCDDISSQPPLLARAHDLAEQISCQEEIHEVDVRSVTSVESVIHALVTKVMIPKLAEEEEAERRRVEPLLADQAARWSKGWRRYVRGLLEPTTRVEYVKPG